jgi:hypothetical protein
MHCKDALVPFAIQKKLLHRIVALETLDQGLQNLGAQVRQKLFQKVNYLIFCCFIRI